MFVELQEPIFAITEAAAGLIGTGINALATLAINRRNQQEQRRVDDLNRQRALEDRLHDEAFNSPSAQRKRLEEAGLSPYAYDVATVAKTDSSAMPQAQAYQATAPDLSNAFSGFAADAQLGLQRDQLTENKRQFDLAQEQKAYQFAESMARTDVELQQKAQALAETKRKNDADIQKIKAEIVSMRKSDNVKDMEVAFKAEELCTKQFENSKLEEQYNLDRRAKIADISQKELGVKQTHLDNEFLEKSMNSRVSQEDFRAGLMELAQSSAKIQNREDALNYASGLIAYGLIAPDTLQDVGFSPRAAEIINSHIKKLRDSDGKGLNNYEKNLYNALTNSEFARECAQKNLQISEQRTVIAGNASVFGGLSACFRYL